MHHNIFSLLILVNLPWHLSNSLIAKVRDFLIRRGASDLDT
jgi:hypothetical protein